MNNQTIEKLRQMRLFGMHNAFNTSLENTIKKKMTQDQFVSHLIHSEYDNRKNRAVEQAVRPAQKVISLRLVRTGFADCGLRSMLSPGLRPTSGPLQCHVGRGGLHLRARARP